MFRRCQELNAKNGFSLIDASFKSRCTARGKDKAELSGNAWRIKHVLWQAYTVKILQQVTMSRNCCKCCLQMRCREARGRIRRAAILCYRAVISRGR